MISTQAICDQIERNKQEMIEALQGQVRIDSVEGTPEADAPFGKGPREALDQALALGKTLGFSVKDVDHYAGIIEFGEGPEMLGILCHLDVVPEGNDWTHPPFGAVIENGRMYGRGTYDDKGPAIASLYAMKALKDLGFQPNKRVRLILGTNEESGSACLEHYVKVEEIPTVSFSPDAEFPVIHGEMGILVYAYEKVFTDYVDDGGLQVLSLKGGHAPNMVPDTATAVLKGTQPIEDIVKAYIQERSADMTYSRSGDTVTLTAKGVSAHGSMPHKGKNAIGMLLGLLELLDLQVGDAANYIRFLSRHIGMETDGKGLGLDCADAYNALVLNLGVIDVTPERGSATVNIRFPITLTEAEIRPRVEAGTGESGIAIANWHCAAPLFFEPSHPLVSTLMEVYRERTGDMDAKAVTIGGGTYAREVPNAVAFGALFPGAEDTMHQRDEYIAIDDLMRMTDIYAHAIVAMCSDSE